MFAQILSFHFDGVLEIAGRSLGRYNMAQICTLGAQCLSKINHLPDADMMISDAIEAFVWSAGPGDPQAIFHRPAIKSAGRM